MEQENKVTLMVTDESEQLYVNGKSVAISKLLSSIDVLTGLIDSGVIKQFEVKRL